MIEIKRAHDKDNPGHRTFRDVEKAAHNMSGLALGNYTLLINGREYPWPDDLKGQGLLSSYREKMLVKHIQHCVELDKAFYG